MIKKARYNGLETVPVVNKFMSFHLPYVVYYHEVMGRVGKEFGLSRGEIHVIAAVSMLVDSRPYVRASRSRDAKAMRTVFATRRGIYELVSSVFCWVRFGAALRKLVEGKFLKLVRKTKGGINQGPSSTLYAVDVNGVKVFRMYSRLMSELHTDNFYSHQVRRSLKAVKEGKLPKSA